MAAEHGLIARIRAVFGRRAYPGDDHLVVDTTGEDVEQAEIDEAFRGKRWDEVPIATLARYHAALSFFTSEAFAYYLPAFMLAALEQPDKCEDARFALLYALIPPSISFRTFTLDLSEDTLALLPPETRDILQNALDQFKAIMKAGGGAEYVEQRQQSLFESKMGGFAPDEKAVIRDFLEALRDNGDDDAQKALDGYWEAAAQ